MQQPEKETGFQRHVRACNNVELPGARLLFFIGDQPVGWVPDRIASALETFPVILRLPDRVTLTDPQALPGIAHALHERGMYRFRNELFDVRATPEGEVLTRIDRGAIPSFGIQAVGVHVNGLVRQPDGLYLWVARRARDKLLDPGKLDHIVAGGVASGLGLAETLVKEAGEEAAIPASLASQAVHAGVITYAMERAEGLRRDRLHCYDLLLPDDFIPQAADGEVEAFELWPMDRAFETVRDTEDFKFNVNLALIDLFIRQGLITGADALTFRSGLQSAYAN